MIKEKPFKEMDKEQYTQVNKVILYLYFSSPNNGAGDIANKIGWSKARVQLILSRNIAQGKNMIQQKEECLGYYEEIKHLIP